MPQGSNFEYCYPVDEHNQIKRLSYPMCSVIRPLKTWGLMNTTDSSLSQYQQVRRLEFSKISNLDLTYIVKVAREDLVTR